MAGLEPGSPDQRLRQESLDHCAEHGQDKIPAVFSVTDMVIASCYEQATQATANWAALPSLPTRTGGVGTTRIAIGKVPRSQTTLYQNPPTASSPAHWAGHSSHPWSLHWSSHSPHPCLLGLHIKQSPLPHSVTRAKHSTTKNVPLNKAAAPSAWDCAGGRP